MKRNPSGTEHDVGDSPSTSNDAFAYSEIALNQVIADLVSGVSVNADDTSADNGEPGVLKVSSVSDGQFFPGENKRILPEERERARQSVGTGDLLISRANTFELIGACGIASNDHPNLFLSDKLWRVVLKSSSQDCVEWLNQVLNSSNVRVQLRARCSGTSGSMKNISKDAFLGITVMRPPYLVQKTIAAVLSAWDQAIGQTIALIAAKEQLKQGLVQKLFDATIRFRGFRDNWDSRHLGDIFEERREPGIENLPMLSVTLDSGVIPRDDIDKPVRTSLEHAEHRLVRAGDIAYNMMRMWQGGCGIVAEDGLISPAYVACKPTTDIDSRFAHHLFHSPRMIYLFWAYSYGLTDDRRRLYFQEFARIPVTLPSVKEQKKIAAVIDNVDLEIAQLKRSSEALKKQKRGLMQQLLTGKVRVPEKLLKKAAKS